MAAAANSTTPEPSAAVISYAWAQTSDSVVVSTRLPPGARTSDITCFFYKDSMRVCLNGNPLLPSGMWGALGPIL